MTEGKRASIDWEAVEREFRAGQLSVREIGRQFGVSHVTIVRRAKDKGWTQDLAEKVRKEATNRLATSDATTSRAGTRQAVEEAAARVVQIVREQRVKIGRGMKLADALFGELEADIEASLKDKSIILGNLSGALKTFIGLERQAFNLGDGPSGDDASGTITRIERVVVRPSNPDR